MFFEKCQSKCDVARFLKDSYTIDVAKNYPKNYLQENLKKWYNNEIILTNNLWLKKRMTN